jgi:hypothetical protein
MATLSPQAVVQLWNEMLNEAREKRLGIFGWKNSTAFMKKCDAEFERAFPAAPDKDKDGTNG